MNEDKIRLAPFILLRGEGPCTIQAHTRHLIAQYLGTFGRTSTVNELLRDHKADDLLAMLPGMLATADFFKNMRKGGQGDEKGKEIISGGNEDQGDPGGT